MGERRHYFRNFYFSLRGPILRFTPDLLISVASLYTSLWLSVPWPHLAPAAQKLNGALPLFLLIRSVLIYALGVHRIVWRYFSHKDALDLLRAVAISSVGFLGLTYLMDLAPIPNSTFAIEAVIAGCLMCGARLARRILHEKPYGKRVISKGRRTLIYGAGNTGRSIAQGFQTNTRAAIRVIGFLDDDPTKRCCSIGGTAVLGTGEDLEKILKRERIQEVIIAVEKPAEGLIKRVVVTCKKFNISPKLTSNQSLCLPASRSYQQVRDLQLEDLLGRQTRVIDLSLFASQIQGKRVLITGAGGTIGSELARQIIRCSPSKLLLLDHSEINLFNIDSELNVSTDREGRVVPLLADLKDCDSLNRVFETHRPQVVFHAAAYKHVHLVESNPEAAILNNVLGMKNLLQLSEQMGVETFVLISSDKAVNPVGIMGATKRLCELMMNNAALNTGKRYATVRFGNVLGSSGSLVPSLIKQIETEGVITITEREMVRYFMLLGEAISLVLKAASIAQPGDIMVLRMGDPVRIIDLAKNLIVLMGRSEEDVQIVYTGKRPGEKLFEELYITGNEINTEDPDILIVPRGGTQKGMGLLTISEAEVDSLIENARLLGSNCKLQLMDMVHNAKPAQQDPKAMARLSSAERPHSATIQ